MGTFVTDPTTDIVVLRGEFELQVREALLDLRTAVRALDETAPVVTAFTLGTPTYLVVPITALTATDAIGVTGYAVTESNVAPALGTFGTAPTDHTFASAGTYTLYAWARDAAGNISSSQSAGPVTVAAADSTAPDSPSITVPANATSTAVTGISLSAHDDVGVTAYFIKDVAGGASAPSSPAAGDAGWQSVTSAVNYSSSSIAYTVGAMGARDCYAWFKDAAGNVSSASSVSTVAVADVYVTKYWTGYTLVRDVPLVGTADAGYTKGGFAFKLAGNKTITKIEIRTQTHALNHTYSNTVRLRILGDSAGLPNESDVKATITGITGMPSAIDTDWVISVDLPTPVALTAGTQYHVLADIPSPSGSSRLYSMCYHPDPASDGFAGECWNGSWVVFDDYLPALQLWGY